MSEQPPKILVVTTRTKFPKRFGASLRRRLDVGPDCHVELLTVYVPNRPIEIDGVRTVDPSVLPWRPLVPVSGPATAEWGGPRRQLVRGLRAGRRALAGAPRPQRLRSTPQQMLASACRTSRDLHRYVAGFDVVVSLEAEAALGVWWLSRRVPGPLMIHKPGAVRRTLAARGIDLPPRTEDDVARDTEVEGVCDPAVLLTEPTRLLIAPANYAGQAGAWARAVREHVPGVSAMNLRAGVLKNPFPADCTVPTSTYAGDLEWRLQWRSQVMETVTHVIVEANLPILGASSGTAADNVLDLQRAGKKVALLSHGSDGRIPSVHAANERWHPYDALDPRVVRALEVRSRSNVEAYRSFDGPVFVSTPGLVEFIPDARWLPNIIDIARWHRDDEPLHRPVPVVAHVPSGPQKGSHMIDPILERMAAAGQIEYRRLEGVPFDAMPELYGTADIVVEQFGIADYSAAACEAMAAGRVVVSRVADKVRERVLDQTGLQLPIEEANPTTLEQVILKLIADPDRARELAARGRDYARKVHDGRRSAAILGEWLHGGGA
jgi:hypothetical protein